jgi:hypothetical protein
LLEEVPGSFSVYDSQATWKSLSAMVGIFNRLARKVSSQLTITYPEDAEKRVLSYLAILKERAI